jgi:hypothetical protein
VHAAGRHDGRPSPSRCSIRASRRASR